MSEVQKNITDTRSDATAILASLGAFAVLANDIVKIAYSSVLVESKESPFKEIGQKMLKDCAETMKTARERMYLAMNDMADLFNRHDGCYPALENVCNVPLAIFRMRERGEEVES